MRNAECGMRNERLIRPFAILPTAFGLPHWGCRCLLLSGIVLLVAAGCEGFPSRQPYDPMLGTPPRPQPVTAPSGPANTSIQTTADTDPPSLPASYTAVSPAALAGGETATQEKGRDLRIPGDTSTPASLPGNGAARGVAPGITMGNPVPAASDSTSRLAPVPTSGAALPQPVASAAPASGGAGMTFDQAQRLLKQYRVSWQRLDMDDGGWKFECGVPNPTNPAVNRHFATTKPFPDEVSAMREVIGQIEKNRP